MLNRIILLLLVTVGLSACNTAEKKGPLLDESVLQMQSPAMDSCGEPYLFADKNGLVYLSWIEKKGKQYHLRFSTLANEKWSDAITVASGDNWFVNWADYPVIASSGDGHLIAHYLQKSDSGSYTYDIFYTTSADNGNTWAAPGRLNNDGKKAEHGFVSMAPYDGKFIVSWLDGRNTVDAAPETHGSGHEGHHGQMTLRAALVSHDGKRGQEWELDDRVCDCCQTSVAIGTEGPIVTYRDRSGSEIRDIGIVRMTGSAWSKPAIVSPDNWKIEGCPVNGPHLDAMGNTVGLAWFTGKDDSGQVKVTFSSDGGMNFGRPVKLNTKKSVGRVDLVMIDSSTAAVSWIEDAAIRITTVDKDGKTGKTIPVAAIAEARSSGFPQIVKSGNKIYVAWTDSKSRSIRCASLSVKS